MAFEGDSRSHVAGTSPWAGAPAWSRAAMEENYGQHNEVPVEHLVGELDAHPSYDGLLQNASRQKFNVQPREDEGKEVLPPYSCAISLESLFSKKMEFEGAIQRATNRSWHRVYVTLQGTALTFHKFKSSGLLARSGSGRRYSPDVPAGAQKGGFLRSYNLQHADMGVAADYFK